MEPGGHAPDGSRRKRLGERLQERITTGTVTGSHTSQVTIEFAAGQEVSERVLFDVRGPAVGEQFLAAHRVHKRGRDDQPADAERRCQGLARRAGVDDVIGIQALERTDSGAVVPVLGVVVVLDRDRAALA